CVSRRRISLTAAAAWGGSKRSLLQNFQPPPGEGSPVNGERERGCDAGRSRSGESTTIAAALPLPACGERAGVRGNCLTASKVRQILAAKEEIPPMQIEAAVFRKVQEPLTIEAVDVDKPLGREVLVRTVATGVCHSDL